MIPNPLKWTNSVRQLWKEIPPPVHSFFAPPMKQIVPKEIAGNLPSKLDVWVACYGLENLSDRVLREIVIKLPGQPSYDPVVKTAPGMTLRKWVYDRPTQEIRVAAVDPQEAIYITLFLRQEDCNDFSEPIVLIGDRLLTAGMQRHAYYKRNPKMMFWWIAVLIIATFALAVTGYSVYTAQRTASRSALIQETLEEMPSCKFVVLHDDEITERRLRGSSFEPTGYLSLCD